jgi:hypothetical protein
MVYVFPAIQLMPVGRWGMVQNLACSDFLLNTARCTSAPLEPSSISLRRIHMIGLDGSELIEAIWYVRSWRTPCFTVLYGTISLLTACATTAIVPAFYRSERSIRTLTWKLYAAGIENFRSSLSVSQREGWVIHSRFHAPLPAV